MAGTLVYTPASGTIPGAGPQSLSVTFTPTDSTDYVSVTATATIVVSQATPSITWNAPSLIVYGTALGSSQLDASADVPGTFSFNPGVGAILGAGTHTLSLTFTPSDSADYTPSTATTTIAVVQPPRWSRSPTAAASTTARPSPLRCRGRGRRRFGTGTGGCRSRPDLLRGERTGGARSGRPPDGGRDVHGGGILPRHADYSVPSGPPVTFDIAPTSTAVALDSSAGSVIFGQPFTLTATATAGAGTPTGAVTFLDGTTTLGVVALDASGRAVLIVGGLGLGGHSIAAVYGGDADRSGGRSAVVTESVAAADTQVVLVPHAVLKRAKVVALNLTAEVEPLAPGGGVPAGIVTFIVKKKTLGTAALNGGQATLSLKPASVLNKSITISYGGGDAFLPTSSASTPVTTGSLAAMHRASHKGPMARPFVRGMRDGRHLRHGRSAPAAS